MKNFFFFIFLINLSLLSSQKKSSSQENNTSESQQVSFKKKFTYQEVSVLPIFGELVDSETDEKTPHVSGLVKILKK